MIDMSGRLAPGPTYPPMLTNWARMDRTILLVDDDAGVRTSLAKLLKGEGLAVATAADGNGALQAVRRIRPDLVLLDVLMPDLNGFEVCRLLKRNPDTRLIPVVLLTGLSAADDRVRGLEAGADDFITKPPDRIELLARVRSLLRMKSYTDELERAEAVLLALARSIEMKDPYTEGHCERLSAYAAALGLRIELSIDETTALQRAGVLHDIGKVAIPDSILLKPGPLTDDEWDVVREHPVTGEHICSPIRSFAPVLPIIRHHHERYAGSGYPDGLAGDEIPVTARVLQVVDVYDALTTARSYKPALTSTEAIATMQEEVDRGWWDPQIFGELRRLLADTDTELSAGETVPPPV
jgi:putative two-component system response regulator